MRRTDPVGDPSVKRWNASIRMANFASFDQSPLCVSSKPGYMRSDFDFPPQLGAVGALLDHLIRERAVGDLSDGVEVRGIELLTLYVRFIPPATLFPDQRIYPATASCTLTQMRCGKPGVWGLKCEADILSSSLQVFDPEDHASLHSDKSKEGLSIYGGS